MGWRKKKADPIDDRAKALSEEIARLEGEIKKLDSALQRTPVAGKPRSDFYDSHPAESGQHPRSSRRTEVVFEQVDPHALKGGDSSETEGHYNELGVRKYDLPALFRRIRNHFRGPTTTNPKLVSYLAAGGMQGLRPLRYEKRVARNRFVVLFIGLFLMLLGLIWFFMRHAR